VVRWPGNVMPGTTSDAMVEYVDVVPTFVDIAAGETDPAWDGRSFKEVIRGTTDRHKQHVFGIMTTNGIINGTDCYPIRSVRSESHKLILNFNHEAVFTNACTQSPEFRSMVQAAEAGDAEARRLVDLYQHRPAVELYDVRADPLEMTNLADAPGSTAVIADLRSRLEAWMREQGDLGIETELAAGQRQRRGRR